ncbi:hypothetical protein [Enterococcus faecium]|uniref:hypothetical protein n=1 Tax=Enterococcus faecium TaxID=1352 RepID=UPI002152D75A|nr:hypothetical protein [Enterococcus faecium]
MGFLADIIFEDYKITLTHGEHKFKLNVYDIKTTFCDIHNIKFVTKMLYTIPSTALIEGLLESNANMAYGGETLTPEQLQRVRDVLAGMFWKFKKEDKDKEK